MAKYSRFDPRNKKKNRHKNRYLDKSKNQQADRRRSNEAFDEEYSTRTVGRL